jgi:peptidoglycan hydrolase CwlO-like protein
MRGMHRRIQYFLSVILIIAIVLTGIPFSGVTQVFAADQQQINNAQANKTALEGELSQLEQEIAQEQTNLASQKDTTGSIARNIAALTSQIKIAKLNIKSANLTITKLGGEITQKVEQINTLESKIDSIKNSLAQLIRKDRELDGKSILALILSQDTISNAYGDIQNFSSIKRNIKSTVDEINGVKAQTETEKTTLETQKNKQIDVRASLQNTQHQVEVTEAQKKQLLAISKDKEKQYQKILSDKAARRAQILAILFNLRDVSAISFGKALEYAKFAQGKTGIDPAFLLAIITQESNLGTDQGSCYVTNMDTGAGVSSKSNRAFPNVMKPTRDIKPFTEITTSLGRDPYKTLVSCPIASAGSSSWGGAMGPAQFIPSTWIGMKNRVTQTLGISAPDPWNPRDAFTASALFLTDLGARAGSFSSEIKAACKYYGSGGSSCPYGRNVMAKASKIQQTMIDPLQN